jgi:hypothetical protein
MAASCATVAVSCAALTSSTFEMTVVMVVVIFVFIVVIFVFIVVIFVFIVVIFVLIDFNSSRICERVVFLCRSTASKALFVVEVVAIAVASTLLFVAEAGVDVVPADADPRPKIGQFFGFKTTVTHLT